MTGPGFNLTGRDIDRRDRMRGFARIGYHYVIERDGKTFIGRPESDASVHDDESDAKRSVGICLVGGANERNGPDNNFTPQQHEALRRVCYLIGTDKRITSVVSKTLAITSDQVSQILWRNDA